MSDLNELQIEQRARQLMVVHFRSEIETKLNDWKKDSSTMHSLAEALAHQRALDLFDSGDC